jgi:hypothetical protein
MPVSGDEIRKSLQDHVFGALSAEGVTLQYLAKKLKAELNSKISKIQKVKGSPNELPRGYRRITTTGVVNVVQGEDGPEREYSDGESLIQWNEADMAIRQRARMDAHKLLNHYPAERHEHTGKDGGPIETKDTTTLEDLSDDAIVARLNELRAERRGAPAPRSSAKKKSKS